ncbi:MAG TPA: TonB-dependent siderophore receptor [Pseudomonas xinjiangensis]|uniref:TonB-dependent siderophore receptor n=2 Tax=root TaxID=1 RepID=A0A7V1BPI8_9GAMM|nr:TonB-dependent siderophore receptor [Halopseudomonas xinjiangensis]HEC46306.1 TonB-dependent siderophore receptor [Halopseudomonas xinjiangensis]
MTLRTYRLPGQSRLSLLRAASSPYTLAAALSLTPAALLFSPHAALAAETGAGETDSAEVMLKPMTITGVNGAPPSVTEQSDSYTIGSTSTATRLELSPRETPQTTITVTQQQIEDFRLNNATDLLRAGGVNVQRVETDRTYYSVRGFDVSNFQIDGLGLPFTTSEQMGDIDTALYDHVEILKGANGLTASPGNPAATINFVRKRPTDELQASGAISYGSWQTRRAEIDVSGPMNEAGTLRGRVVAAGQDGDSYLDRYSLSKTVFSGIIEADLTDSSTATFGYSEQRNRPEGIMWGALSLYYTDGSKIDYSRSHSSSPDWTYWNTDDKQAFAELNTDWAGGWQSKASLSYREITSDAEQLVVIGVPDRQTGLGLTTYASKYDRIERQLLGDVYIKGPFDLFGRTHEVVAGTNWSRSTNRWTSYDDEIGTPLPPVFEYNGNFPRPAFDEGLTSSSDYVTYRRSFYTAAHLNATDKLKLVAGANYTQLDSSGFQLSDPHEYSRSKTTPYFGAVYDLNDNYSGYASYTEIFSPQYLVDASKNTLEPIEGNSVEGGIKGEWFHKRLNASVALFRTKQENTAEYAGFDSDAGFSFYAPVDTTSKGYELTLAGQLTPNWELSSGLTHLFSLEDTEGRKTRTYIPQNFAYLSTTYKVPQLDGLKIGGSVNWQSEIFREEGTTASGDQIVSRQGSYAVVNALASYDLDEHFNIALNVNNLLDRKYLTSLYWSQSYYAAPRNAMATLTWTY